MPRPTTEQLNRMKESARGRKGHHSEQWGGKRPGAGRTPVGNTRKVTKSISLSAEVVTKLERAAQLGRCSMSEIIENLLKDNLMQP